MQHSYTLYIDEAGHDKVERLKPSVENGNSEWLCLGGYLVRSENVAELIDRRDALVTSIGGQPGQALHYRNYKAPNRLKICTGLANFSARAFVVCSYKRTMVGHHNERAAAAGNVSSNRQYLYNFVVRLLLERVTAFVEDHAISNGLTDPVIRIVLASRRGHHFGHFKAYVLQLMQQATAQSTYLNQKEIKPNLLRYGLIERAPASSLAGLQLADTVVSSVFQSIKQTSPGYEDGPAERLRRIIAGKQRWENGPVMKNNVGLTVFPTLRALKYINSDQEKFFSMFGYDFEWLRKQRK